MSRLVVASTIVLFAGTVLLLSTIRWFARRPLTERLRRYVPTTAPGRQHPPDLLSVESFRDVLAPLAETIGAQVSRLFGVSEELETRLRRIHSPLDVTGFRTRQLGWSLVAFAAAAGAGLLTGMPAPATVLLAMISPLIAFLTLEQQLANASERRQRLIFLELPVFAEQLAMLLSAGYSLNGALHRLAQRGNGAIAQELRTVVARTRQGLTDTQALRELAALASVEGLDRLVGVLSLNQEATNLGTLVTQEARAIRRDAHRELLEAIERKNLQVWIPVTVAALVPGVILIAIPFIDALNTFNSG